MLYDINHVMCRDTETALDAAGDGCLFYDTMLGTRTQDAIDDPDSFGCLVLSLVGWAPSGGWQSCHSNTYDQAGQPREDFLFIKASWTKCPPPATTDSRYFNLDVPLVRFTQYAEIGMLSGAC